MARKLLQSRLVLLGVGVFISLQLWSLLSAFNLSDRMTGESSKMDAVKASPSKLSPVDTSVEMVGSKSAVVAGQSSETDSLVTLDSRPSGLSSGPASKVQPSESSAIYSDRPVDMRWLTKQEVECERQFGLPLFEEAAMRAEEWCAPTAEAPLSRIVCYPVRNDRQKKTHIFCEGRDVYIDFSKVGATDINGKAGAKQPRGLVNFHTFSPGATFSPCAKTDKWQRALYPEKAERQFTSFLDRTKPSSSVAVESAPGTTYLLPRDHDYENMFHATADFINMVGVGHTLGLNYSEVQVVLFDRHPVHQMEEMVQVAFSPNKPLKRAADYGGAVVRFDRLVWHLESPASVIPPVETHCSKSSLFRAYARHVLEAFKLWDVPAPPVPTITLSLRKRTPVKNVGRVLANEQEVVDMLNAGNMLYLNVAEFGEMTIREQLELVRKTSVLVGVHGAGLMHIIFAAEEAVLVEIHPSYRLDYHFRHAARMSGKAYMPFRSTLPVSSCKGTSDDITVDVADFRAAVDGAIRLARSFHGGRAECGLLCPGSILALDRGNDAHYTATRTTRERPLSTRFPC